VGLAASGCACEGNRSDGQAFISLTKPEQLPELPAVATGSISIM